jgi:hypothetical protein
MRIGAEMIEWLGKRGVTAVLLTVSTSGIASAQTIPAVESGFVPVAKSMEKDGYSATGWTAQNVLENSDKDMLTVELAPNRHFRLAALCPFDECDVSLQLLDLSGKQVGESHGSPATLSVSPAKTTRKYSVRVSMMCGLPDCPYGIKGYSKPE